MQFSEIKTKLDTLAGDINTLEGRVNDLAIVATAIGGLLDALPGTYSELIAAIDAAASGSSDAAKLTAKAEKDLLVAEYLTTKAKITSVLAAFA